MLIFKQLLFCIGPTCEYCTVNKYSDYYSGETFGVLCIISDCLHCLCPFSVWCAGTTRCAPFTLFGDICFHSSQPFCLSTYEYWVVATIPFDDVRQYCCTTYSYRTREVYLHTVRIHTTLTQLYTHTHINFSKASLMYMTQWLFEGEELLSALVRVHYYQHSITTHCTSVCSGNSNYTRADMTRLSVIVTT